MALTKGKDKNSPTGEIRSGRQISMESKQRSPRESNEENKSEAEPTGGQARALRLKAILSKILENKFFTVFMTVITVYVLFGDDVRLVAFKKGADDYFFAFTAACFFFFTVEVVSASFATEGYFLSFYFWLDLLATISLVFDIGWIWDEIVGT